MKKINYLLTFIFVFLAFCATFNVSAVELPRSLGTIVQVGERVMDTSGYGAALKVNSAGTYATLCTHYNTTSPAGTGVECIKNEDWDEATRYGVAAIINEANKIGLTTTGMTPAYFAGYLAINEFVYSKSSGVYGEDIAGSSLSSTYSTIYNNYLELANNAYSRYAEDSNVSFDLSSERLNFKKIGSKYVSDVISVNGATIYDVVTTVGVVNRDGNTFKIEVNDDEISASTTVKVTVTAMKELDQARNYTCGTYQSLTPNAVETITKTGIKYIEGTIDTGTIVIKKVDEDGNFITGSKIKIQCTSKDCDYEEVITTVGGAYTISGLQIGTYLIKEVEAPEGYILNNSGKIVKIETSHLYHETEIVNNKTKLEISKLDAKTGKFLPGAKLQLEDKSGNVVKYCIDASGKKNSECIWESGNENKVITGLPYGTYYLVELSAPKGYELHSDKIEISLSEKNSYMKIELMNDVPDTLNSKSTLLVAISMFDIALGIGIISYVKKNKVEE